MNKTMKKAVIAAAVGGAAAAAAAAGGIAKTRHEMKKEFSRGKYPDRRFTTQYIYENDYAEKHPRENVHFKSGENTLQGYIYGLENTEPKGLLVFAHGITVGHESYINMLMWFTERGWRVFAYDGTGSCTSEGEGTVGLVQSALDLDCALNYAATDERLAGLPVYLLGHSWGGYAVCAVQNFEHDITAAASLSGYNDPVEMLKVGSEDKLGKTGVKLFTPFIKGYNKLTFGENSGLNAADGLNKSGIPTIVIHGENDDFVDFSRVSVYSKQDKITNPKVEFVKLTGRYSNHIRIFKSDRSNDYTLEYMKELNELIAEYAAKVNSNSGSELTDTQKKAGVTIVGAEVVPDEVRAEFLKKWDKALLNEVNSDLFETIESFFINNSEKV